MAKFNPLKILSPITNLIGGGKNPHTEGLPYLNAVPNFGREAYNPFIEEGRAAAGMLPDYSFLANVPAEYLSMLMAQYEPSAMYQHRLQEGMKGMGAAAASGGFAGTDYDQQMRGELANELAGVDMQQFLNNVLGIQEFGAKGLEAKVGRGYQSSADLADYLGGAYGQLGLSASAGREAKNANRQEMINNLVKAGATAAGAAAGVPINPYGGGGGGGSGAAPFYAYGNPGGYSQSPYAGNQPSFVPLNNLNTSYYRNQGLGASGGGNQGWGQQALFGGG